MSKKIRTLTSLTTEDDVYIVKLKGVSFFELLIFSLLMRTSVFNYRHKNRYYIPMVYILCLFRRAVKKLYSENNKFPLKQLSNFDISSKMEEYSLFLNEDIVFKFTRRSKHGGYHLFFVEITKNNDVSVLSGLYKFS